MMEIEIHCNVLFFGVDERGASSSKDMIEIVQRGRAGLNFRPQQ
jgi:hypothetical protein